MLHIILEVRWFHPRVGWTEAEKVRISFYYSVEAVGFNTTFSFVVAVRR
jgi:hypothetical protein